MRKQGSAAAAAVALLLASCSSASPASTTTVPRATTMSPTTTTLSATPTSTVVPTTTTVSPSTTVSSEAVGSSEELERLIQEVAAEVGHEAGASAAGGILDLTNPDPIAAFFSIVAFEDWALKNSPDPAWARLLGVPGSEGFRSYRNGFDSVSADGTVWVDRGAPYSVFDIIYINLDEIPVSVPSDFDPPEGSVVFIHDSSKGPFDVVRSATGETIESRPGWDSIEHVVVLSPSVIGWSVYFSEVMR